MDQQDPAAAHQPCLMWESPAFTTVEAGLRDEEGPRQWETLPEATAKQTWKEPLCCLSSSVALLVF